MLVQGDVIWVRRCRMRSSSRRLPKLERRPGSQPTNGLAVVAHEFQGLATEFEALIHPTMCIFAGIARDN